VVAVRKDIRPVQKSFQSPLSISCADDLLGFTVKRLINGRVCVSGQSGVLSLAKRLNG